MDTTTLLYIGLAVIVVGVLVYQVVTSNSRRNKRFLSSIINSWGNLPKREYDYGELEHIAKYFQATKQQILQIYSETEYEQAVKELEEEETK